MQKVCVILILFFNISDGFGIDEAFESVTRQVLKRRYCEKRINEEKRVPKSFFDSLIVWLTNSATKGEATNQDLNELEEMMK